MVLDDTSPSSLKNWVNKKQETPQPPQLSDYIVDQTIFEFINSEREKAVKDHYSWVRRDRSRSKRYATCKR